MKRTVEIEDDLWERVEQAQEKVKNLLIEWLEKNETPKVPKPKVPDLQSDLNHDGQVSEIIEGCAPVYTREVQNVWYFYWDLLEEAYEKAGNGSNPRENYGRTAILRYIEQEVAKWYQDFADDIVKKWVIEKQRRERTQRKEKKGCDS